MDMNEKLTNYLNGVFAPYEGVKSVAELKADLLSDLQERFRELKAEGKDDETAFEMTIDSIGDIEQMVREVTNLSRSLERQVLINFSASDLPNLWKPKADAFVRVESFPMLGTGKLDLRKVKEIAQTQSAAPATT